MKPIYLRFSAFGAYKKEQIIDFKKLSENGIFLITGKTGSGKTVILDAMTYALYGKSSGGARGDISDMRCQFASDDMPTEVEFIFEIRDRVYKFTRTLKRARKNFNMSQNAMFMDERKTFVPFFENPKLRDVEEKANELIGLTYEQFRQVVILPQGQFERLLVAKSEEKEEILVSLFNAAQWQNAADNLSNTVNEERRRLDSQKDRIDRMLLDNECESIEDLSDLIDEERKEKSEYEVKEQDISKNLLELRERLEKETVIYNDFLSLSQNQKKFEDLSNRQERIDNLKDKLSEISRSKLIEPLYNKMSDTKVTADVRKTNFEKQVKKVDKLKIKLKSGSEELELLNSKKAANTEDELLILKMNEMTGLCEKLDEQTNMQALLSSEKNNTLKQLDIIKAKIDKLDVELQNLDEQKNNLYDMQSSLLRAYVDNVSGRLAQKLKGGDKCPVCGSTTHPQLAKLSDTAVSDDDISKGQEKIDNLNKKIKKQSSLFDEQKELYEKKRIEFDEISSRVERIGIEIENIVESLGGEKITGAELVVKTEKLKEKVQDFKNSLSAVTDEVKEIESSLAAERKASELLSLEYDTAREIAQNAEKDFNEKLIENEFSTIDEFLEVLKYSDKTEEYTKEISDFSIEIKSVKNNITILEEKLLNIKKPNISELKDIISTLEGDRIKINSDLAVLKTSIDKRLKVKKELKEELEKWQTEDIENHNNILFVKRLRGDNGVSLERYILGVMLSSITNEANRLLLNVHNGRYRLYRTMQATGRTRKSGLELEVFDNLTNERRAVSTLSGGEKFLVSLSLSIGLSTVVQSGSGGIRLEAMFIDEGFGSLDPQSVSDALMVLSSMKKSNSIIGIISHIDSLKENIPAQIRVEKTNEGSNLVIIA